MTDQVITPQHTDLYAVEEIVVFRNVYLVRAEDADQATDKVKDSFSTSYFQRHISSAPSHAYKIDSDADIVKIMQSTEQPDMTLEEFTMSRDKWLTNVVGE